MRNYMIITVVLFAVAMAGPVYAGATSQTGHITNIVANADGLLIELDNGVPDNCSSTIGYWMVIPNTNKVMAAVALMNSESGKLIEVYSNGTYINGICVVTMLYIQGD